MPINWPSTSSGHPSTYPTTLTVNRNAYSPAKHQESLQQSALFFSRLACHFKFQKDRLERPALQLAQTYAEDKGINIKNFKGVGFNDLSYFEQRHNLRIHVYSSIFILKTILVFFCPIRALSVACGRRFHDRSLSQPLWLHTLFLHSQPFTVRPNLWLHSLS